MLTTKRHKIHNLAAAALVLAFCLQALLAIPRLSPTSDEPIHLAAGYSYWKAREFLRNPEHPPLANLMAAIPLLFLQPQLAPKDADWKQGTDADFGQHFIYGNDADRLIFWARFPMVLLAAIGAIATFLWARDMFGEAAGLLALTLYAFCPNLLAHGMLVNNRCSAGDVHRAGALPVLETWPESVVEGGCGYWPGSRRSHDKQVLGRPGAGDHHRVLPGTEGNQEPVHYRARFSSYH